MSDCLFLAIRSLRHYWLRNGLLSLVISICVFVPSALYLLAHTASMTLRSRAANTPLVVGPAGSETDLVLKSLYFEGDGVGALTMADLDRFSSNRAQRIPLLLEFSADGAQVVGTTQDYFGFRGLSVGEGSRVRRHGDCVVGARFAKLRSLSVGGSVTTESKSMFLMNADYPMRLRVTGVLQPTGTADDDAVFVSLETAWIIAGIGHGHDPPSNEPGLDSAAAKHQPAKPFLEVTDVNVDSFHFHGRRKDYPISCCLLSPKDDRARALILGSFAADRAFAERASLAIPSEVVERLLRSILRLRWLVVMAFLAVGIGSIALVLAVLWMTYRLRRGEFETMRRIGASPLRITHILALEWGGVIVCGAAAGLLLAMLACRFEPFVLNWLL